MTRKVIQLMLTGLFIFAGQTGAQYYISPYEKVYDDLLYLQSAGYMRDIDLNQIPLSTTQITQSLQAETGLATNATINPVYRSLLRKIAESYAKSDTNQSGAQPRLLYGLKLNLDFQNQPSAKLYPQLRTFGSLAITKNLSITNVMALDPYATESAGYIGKEWRGMSGYTEQAYLMYTRRNMRLTAGRSYIICGPGRKSSLLLSAAARPMDNFKLDIFVKNLSFQAMTAKLDPVNGAQRYLSTHRLSVYLGNLAIGLTEALLYSGSAKNLEFAYLNPFLLYHGEQMNGPALNGNTLGALDLGYCGRNWIAYTEFLVDDIQFDKKEVGDLEPNEIGCTVGIDIADPLKIPGLYLALEYTAITNRTYKTTEPSEWFLHRNGPIGYELGSDFDRINLLVRKYFKNWQVALEFDRIRRGEGDLSKAWDSPWDSCTVAQGYSEKFPTGVVETTNDLGLTLTWMPDYGKYLYAGLTYETIKNVDHGNKDDQNFILSVGVYIDLHGKLGL
ncbi:MAG: capsule assembly Wzi family protein [Candidatus Neomarinimicrobiota bacterium]